MDIGVSDVGDGINIIQLKTKHPARTAQKKIEREGKESQTLIRDSHHFQRWKGNSMPTFIPPYFGEEIKSNAEKKMFTILKELELKNAFILHSLGLPRHQSKIYGEIDFVIICELGVACLEIKGGRVECRQGKWYFTDRYHVEREKAEGPFAQVIGNMFSLKKTLKENMFQNPHMRNILMASGVVFTDITFTAKSEEIIPEMIFDRQTESITEYIKGIFKYWERREHRQPNKLSETDIKQIVEYLRGEFTFIPSLGSRLDEVEHRLLRLTREQYVIMEALSENTHLLIEGGAGTGKTVLAVNFAERQATQEKRILYLTYNKNLARNVNNLLGIQYDNLTVINIHAFFGKYVPVDVDKIKANSRRYFAEELPEAFYEYVKNLDTAALDDLQYEVLVIDEGQDVLKPEYMYSLDRILKGGLETGKWVVFYDEKQNIYNPEYSEGMELLTAYPHTKFKLFTNCRNTVEIGSYYAKVSGIGADNFIREQGEQVREILYTDNQDFSEKIVDVIKELRREEVPLEDVVFLSPKRLQNSILGTMKSHSFSLNELSDGYEPQVGRPVFATIQGFKGLDAKVVVVVDTDQIREEVFSKYIYMACSRARTLLVMVKKEGVI